MIGHVSEVFSIAVKTVNRNSGVPAEVSLK